MASELLLRVLGPLRLERDGVEVDVAGARQREVLARLTVANGRPVSAEALLSDVWGPVAGASAASSLHVSVSKLRRAIDPDRRARASSPLVSTAGGYALAVRTDAVDVEERVREASAHIEAGDLLAAEAEVVRARVLWRGEPYEGIGEHSWLVLERRRCEELGLYVAQLYAEISLRLGRDAAGVVVDLTGLVGSHPAHERLAVLLAVALYREQRQDDALAVLRSSRDHLRDHSGLDPGEELLDTERLILAQEQDPYVTPTAASPRTAARSTGPVPIRGYPFVGRGRALAVLEAAAEAVESGQAMAALLVGEAGIGKTRLARVVSENLVARGWQAVWAHCSEDDGAPALWPWISLVRQLGRTVPLVAELESLVEGTGAGVVGVDPATERWRLTLHIAALLRAAAHEEPLLVVLDDLHWSDAASQALLSELLVQLDEEECRVLLVVTTRSGGSPPLATTLARLARLGAIRLEVDGLTDADVQALAASAGVEADPRALREHTDGNPFLLQATLALAAGTGSSPLDVVPPRAPTVRRVDQPEPPPEPVVGREDVLAIIDEVVAQAAGGRGRAVLIEGPAGIGKSTVLRAATHPARRGDGSTLRGAGVAGGVGAPAFWPWTQVLRQLDREFPGLVERAAAPALASIDPALFAGSAVVALEEHDAALGSTRLYRAVVDLLTAASQERPLVVVIDDAHWLDEASARLLTVAVPELTDQGVVFLIGFRSEESLGTHEALAVLGGLRRDLVVRLELAGLGLAGVDEMVRRMNGGEPDPGVTAAISRRTAGNPLFVGELVRLLISEDRLDTDGVDSALPAEVRDVLRRRLERLPEAAVEVLVVAALVGRPVDIPLLVRVADLTDDAVLTACENAALTGLLVGDDEVPGCFALSHDLVRQVLVESVSSARRVRLHARIAEALQLDDTPAPERVVEVAQHLRLAAPLIGAAAAVPFLLAAADDALARLAMEQAETILDDTLALAGGLDRAEERAAVERQVRGRLTALKVFRDGPVVAEASGPMGTSAAEPRLVLDPADPAEWWAAMTVAVALGHYERMVREARSALRPDLSPAVAAIVHLELGLGLFELGRFDGAAVELQKTRALLSQGDAAQSLGLSVSGDAVLNLLAMMAHFRGDEDGADELLAEAMTNVGDSPTRLVVVIFAQAWLAASRGDARACGGFADDCARLGAELAYPAYVGMGQILSGWAASMLGDAAGPAAADDAYAAYVSDGTRLHTTLFSMLRAEAHARHGRPDLARVLVEEARRITAEIGERSLGPRLRALADELAGLEDASGVRP